MSLFLGGITYALESSGDGDVDLVTAWVCKEESFLGYQLPRIAGGLLLEESIRLFAALAYSYTFSPARSASVASASTSRPALRPDSSSR